MSENKRVFLGVRLPEAVKREIAGLLLEEIPRDKWRKVKPENLHITMRFLGYLPTAAINELHEKLVALQRFPAFEAELKSVGHFKGRILWIGTGKGSEELIALSNRLNEIINVRDERFHPHVTLARNKGMQKRETDELIEGLREKKFYAKIFVQAIDLIESKLARSGPAYSTLFSIRLA